LRHVHILRKSCHAPAGWVELAGTAAGGRVGERIAEGRLCQAARSRRLRLDWAITEGFTQFRTIRDDLDTSFMFPNSFAKLGRCQRRIDIAKAANKMCSVLPVAARREVVSDMCLLALQRGY
jgi:hypothetical protein